MYITVAAMLTVLIYIGIIIVKNAVIGEKHELPFEKHFFSSYRKLFTDKEGNINRDLVYKRLTEEWLITLVLLVLISFGLSLLISFSKILVNNEDAGRQILNIQVYIRDDVNTTGDKSRGYYFRTNSESLFIFLSQLSIKRFWAQDLFLILKAYGAIIGKFFILGIWFIRLVVVATIISIAPILVFLNGFEKIKGNKGFLKNVIQVFLVLVVLRPIIAVIFGMLDK